MGSLALVLASVSACAQACTKKGERPPADAAAMPAAKPADLADPAPADAANPAAAQPTLTWLEATRLERWADAAKLVDGLDAKQKEEPTLRYVRARLAIELGDWKRAATLLDGLEKELPLLADEIARHRAEAQLEAGPFEQAAKYYAQRKGAKNATKLALALERAGKLDKARKAIDTALVLAQKIKSKKRRLQRETEARAVRARIAEKQGNPKLATLDLRWIATFAPTEPEAAGVDAKLEELEPKRALTKKERYERAMSMAGEGLVEQTEQELARLDEAPGPKLREAELFHARGWALYMARRDYEKAAALLEKAAKLGSKHALRDRFYAARALSRAHKDPIAIEKYDALAKRFPGSYWGEQASYLSARLHYISGNWQEAVDGYSRYLARYKKGKYTDSAEYERAVARLAGGEHARAAKEFRILAKRTSSHRLAARYRELQGVAALGQGEKKAAAQLFREVIDERPLSFPALVAATRLERLGEPLPPPINGAAKHKPRAPLKIALPKKVELLLSMGLDADAERELERHERTFRKMYAPRGDEALCLAYGKLTHAARRYKVGQRAARWSQLDSAPGTDDRWLWDCIYPKPYEPLVREAEQQHELPSNVLYAVMRQESGFRPHVESPAKAVGLLQLIPPTAKNVARELQMPYEPLLLRSPPYNIKMGSYYFAKVLSTFGGNVALAAAAYNAGPSAVSRWLETGEKLPLDVFVARIPYRETRGYVCRVVGNVARYAYLDGGAGAVPKLSLELPDGLRAAPDAY